MVVGFHSQIVTEPGDVVSIATFAIAEAMEETQEFGTIGGNKVWDYCDKIKVWEHCQTRFVNQGCCSCGRSLFNHEGQLDMCEQRWG